MARIQLFTMQLTPYVYGSFKSVNCFAPVSPLTNAWSGALHMPQWSCNTSRMFGARHVQEGDGINFELTPLQYRSNHWNDNLAFGNSKTA